MSNRRSRSTKISRPAINQDATIIDSALKEGIENSLKARAISLRHHNITYVIGVVIFIWLMFLVYLPLTYFEFLKVFPALWNNQFASLKELVGIFAQRDVGLFLVVLFIIPIYLLSGLLKYNRIDSISNESDNDNPFPNFFSSL
ncbi:MAG: hypothetical protein LBS53_08190 [Synergistaceae bacterium]|nr:hypothetical protein [Synergistaceae bacterium]